MTCLGLACNLYCWQFIVAVCISLIAMGISVAGLCGVFSGSEVTFYQSMLTLVIGVWIKTPDYVKKKKRNSSSSQDV